jgi:hypothetical protein
MSDYENVLAVFLVWQLYNHLFNCNVGVAYVYLQRSNFHTLPKKIFYYTIKKSHPGRMGYI